MRDASPGFASGSVEAGGRRCWWRQDASKVQLVAELEEDESVKYDVVVGLSKTRLTLKVGESAFAEDVELAHPIEPEASTWYVEDEGETACERDAEDAGEDPPRFLVVELAKEEAYMNWAGLEKAGPGADSPELSLDGQRLNFERLKRGAGKASLADVYGRLGGQERCYFLGKVAAADGAPPRGAIRKQAALIRDHALRYQPEVFQDGAGLELWHAPGNSELNVAQDEIALLPVSIADDDDALPPALACGFEPETLEEGSEPFYCVRDPMGATLGGPAKATFAPPGANPAQVAAPS